MPAHPNRLCVIYIPGLDRRRIDAVHTPFIFNMLDCYPSVRIRTLPTTELVPTMISGVWPHQHGIWQVSLRKPIETTFLDRLFDRLPDLLTTTVQCFRHLADPEYDLPAIPHWRRRRLKLHRFKYGRRQAEGWRRSMMAFDGYPTIFALTAPHSRYRFVMDFDEFEAQAARPPEPGLQLDFTEFYGFDIFSHWNLDRPAAVAARLRRVDRMVETLFQSCKARECRMLLLVDHGQEEVRSTIDIFKALKNTGVSREDYTCFTEVACTRLWFHSDEARRRIMSALAGMKHIRVFSSREMHPFDICFDHDGYGEIYVFADSGAIFFPHDYYHPLANLYMGLRRSALRPRIAEPTHRGYHGHLPDHPAEEGYMIMADRKFRSRDERISLIDVAPTLLNLLGMSPPPHMKGQPAFDA